MIYVVKGLSHNLEHINILMKSQVNRNLLYNRFVIPLQYLRKKLCYLLIIIKKKLMRYPGLI